MKAYVRIENRTTLEVVEWEWRVGSSLESIANDRLRWLSRHDFIRAGEEYSVLVQDLQQSGHDLFVEGTWK